ncbi:MAG: flagellar motor switch protein FliN [Pirellulaceae bacterium]|jgi:flagellar motor switch protein FliN/FliY|nr:flagellar motor switch protein FliN [Thermoguttaceae bacterium]NLZ02887.1 flagellar motor switch protein FliN [Pirellulaceae bacterium]
MADDNELINQGDIEAQLRGAAAESGSGSASSAAPNPEDQAASEAAAGGRLAGDSSPAGRRPAEPAGSGRSPADDEGDRRLDGAEASGTSQARPPTGGHAAAAGSDHRTDAAQPSISAADVELLFQQAERALESVATEGRDLPPSATHFQFRELSGSPANTETATLDLLSDVELDLKIELGRTKMYLEDVLRLRKGAVVALDKLAGDPVDIYVNGRLIARGEVLVLNDNFCVRVAELVASTAPAA